MGVLTNIRDRLTNVMSGMGTGVDRRTAAFYALTVIDRSQVEAAYRSSWLVRKIVDVPPFDMTREWRDWQADSADIEKIEREERRLQLKAKSQRALVLARLWGGSAIILGTNGDPMEPVEAERIGTAGLTYAHVLSCHQLSTGQERRDPADPWFGQPEYFEITGGNQQRVRLHPSRVIPFIGQRAPEGSQHASTSWFWGDPIMQSIGEAVRNADLAQAGFASLIDKAKTDILRIPDLIATVVTEEGEARMLTRLGALVMGESTYRATLIDKEEEWEQRQVTWTGMPEMIDAYLNIVAGAADIPVTRLLGQSPKGLQSTGEGEERDYHSMVRARQNELLAPALDQIDELLLRSALGSRPDDIYYEFAPLGGVSEKDAAAIEKQAAETVKLYADTGLIPSEALSAMAKNRIVESGRWPGSEAAFEEAGNALDEPGDDEAGDLLTAEEKAAALQKRGTINEDQARALITDARPRSLYVRRNLLNGAEFIRWAKAQGFETTVPADDLHVTITFSRSAVDWMKMGSDWSAKEDGKLTVPAGGARIVEKLGDKGAVVLLFASSTLSWRHEDMIRSGASHDFDSYQPHVTITYAGSDVDLSKVEPYRGKLEFGPEIFEEVVEDWEKGLAEA
jgi:phage-related protein (TIGR01555 family)